MTNEEAKKMLEAKLKCLIAETSGTNHDCNMRLCDGCALNYEQGNMGEQKQALDMAIKALEQQPKKGKWISKFFGGVEFITCDNCHCGCPSYSYINIDNGESMEKVQLCKTDFCPNCGAKMEVEE